MNFKWSKKQRFIINSATQDLSTVGETVSIIKRTADNLITKNYLLAKQQTCIFLADKLQFSQLLAIKKAQINFAGWKYPSHYKTLLARSTL